MMISKLKDRLLSESELPKNFLRFYAVGLLLFMLPFTRSLFIHVTALSLLLVFGAVLYHHKRWSVVTIVVFTIIAISSFFLEVAGVGTGVLFGTYSYDSGLGLKLFDTPLMIGVNWVFLIYASQAIISQKTDNVFYRIVGGALLMILYDLILEFAAPPMNMWHFSTFYPPIQNFIVWFVASIAFHTLLVLSKVSVDNKPARALFWSQMLFFAIVTLFSLLFIK